ncbi:Hypothetical protein FKW44_013676, partial [Caligus rogercresseyi]
DAFTNNAEHVINTLCNGSISGSGADTLLNGLDHLGDTLCAGPFIIIPVGQEAKLFYEFLIWTFWKGN